MLHHYGVLKGRASGRLMATPANAHYQVLLEAGNIKHRIAINVKSSVSPPEVLFYMDEDFKHPITDQLLNQNLTDGFTKLPSAPGGLALDFIRGNLFSTSEMKPIPFNLPGADNDLNEKLDFYIQKAINDQNSIVFAFGEKWGPEEGIKDKYFDFLPGNGIHDIHMNQGNTGSFKKDNGPYQDGGMFIYFPALNKWVAIFIAFQVQAWHTDDVNGNPLNDIPINNPQQPEQLSPVKIVAAMVNPQSGDEGKEFIILLNTNNNKFSLNNWKIGDKEKHFSIITDVEIDGHSTVKIFLDGNGARLSNKGGIISLLNDKGLKIDGVSYTKAQARTENILIKF